MGGFTTKHGCIHIGGAENGWSLLLLPSHPYGTVSKYGLLVLAELNGTPKGKQPLGRVSNFEKQMCGGRNWLPMVRRITSVINNKLE